MFAELWFKPSTKPPSSVSCWKNYTRLNRIKVAHAAIKSLFVNKLNSEALHQYTAKGTISNKCCHHWQNTQTKNRLQRKSFFVFFPFFCSKDSRCDSSRIFSTWSSSEYVDVGVLCYKLKNEATVRRASEHRTDLVEREGAEEWESAYRFSADRQIFCRKNSTVSLRKFHRQLFGMQTRPVGRKAAL